MLTSMPFKYALLLLILILGLQSQSIRLYADSSLSFSNKTLEQEKAEKQRLALESQLAGQQIQDQEYSITVFTDHVGDPGTEGLAGFLEQQFGVQFAPGNPATQNVIFGQYPFYYIRISGNSFLATFSEIPRPFSPEEISWLRQDQLIQQLLKTHTGYVHLELIHMKNSNSDRLAYDLLNRLGSGLCLPGQTRCVVSFPLKKFFVFDEININSMLDSDSIQLYHTGRNRQAPNTPQNTSRPTTQIPEKRTAKELKEIAQERFSIFKRHFQSKEEGWTYKVLVDYENEAKTHEALWLEVLTISGTRIEGKLADPPLTSKELQKAQIVYVDLNTVLDWVASNDKTTIRGVEEGF
ncbi:MAG: DUF2314 domain-containing protein [Sumerlaeia bacterium]